MSWIDVLKEQGGTIKKLWIKTVTLPRVQIKPIACLASMTPNFKKEKHLGGNITIKKSNSCVLEKELGVINIQQNQQQQQ
ncbi:MAG: hypothetical protein DWH70_10995 [Planctomycetota bacterium]|nr:MAG: hypothetical protein DWH70_10995 [Planctomycetota bacterium]